MPSLKENSSCSLPRQQLSYLVAVKGRSPLQQKYTRLIQTRWQAYLADRKRGVL